MYRVMIVDDEKSLRALLRKSIDWEMLGFNIVAEAASGVEAINIIDKYSPHLMFIDIRMPFMDGIELAGIIRKQYPHIKIVILTAYDEFEYARKCVEIGVTNYLLKPIARTDIYNTCYKIAEEFNQLYDEAGVDINANEIVPEESEYTPDDYDSGYDPRVLKQQRQKIDIDKVQEFIRDNSENPALNLTSVASTFGYNPSYLSRVFKEDAGTNLSDYIMSCRMEKAMKCAENYEPMYVTAQKVGIPDPAYFGKCFKKFTGKSYTETMKSFKEQQ
ncbi:response regulator transcription factor [Eubacterium xylanophilum]|uniref:response regulator transcription factor n=1 Tax=Eubacterium xylanophilum TaxID=39497 RepID=UPI00047D2C2F|nr:response regulator [Eubacterium xylanophilum]MCR5796303.1 response regulator [Eubacterium sp.]